MSDNTIINIATNAGDIIATEDIDDVKIPRTKLVIGEYGTDDGDISSTNPMPVTGTVTATPTGTQTVSGTVTANAGSGTFTVSGTVTANAGSGTLAVSAASLPLPSGAATAAKQPALGTAGTPSTDVITVQGHGSGTALPVSAASLPLPSGAATSAKQPALGTAGTPSTDVITVQGHASGTALKVDGSAVTQPVSLGSVETHVGEVGTPCTVISITPTINTAQFTSGDAVGGKQTLTSAARVSSGTVILESLTLVDKGNQKAAMTVLFFNSDPSAATITNNSAFAFSTDVSKVVGKVNIVAEDYETIDSIAIASVKAVALQIKASGSANLFAAVVTTGTPTYTSTTDLIFYYGFLQS